MENLTLYVTENLYGNEFDYHFDNAIGKTIKNRYSIKEYLFKSDINLILLAYDRLKKIDVVIKMCVDNKFKNLIKNEYEKLKTLKDIFTYFKEIDYYEGDQFIPPFVMYNFLKGEKLSHLIKEEKLNKSKILKILLDLSDNLFKIHEKKIIYLDLKPDNILFCEDKTTKIIDYGISLFEYEKNSLIGYGTDNYISPEILKGDEFDYRSDQFSFGILIYNILTGELPFEEYQTEKRTVNSFIKNPGIADEFWYLIKKLTNKNPKLRFKDFNEVKKEILIIKYLYQFNLIELNKDDVLDQSQLEKIEEKFLEDGFLCEDFYKLKTLMNKLKKIRFKTDKKELEFLIDSFINDNHAHIADIIKKEFLHKLKQRFIDFEISDFNLIYEKNLKSYKLDIEKKSKPFIEEADSLFKVKKYEKALELYLKSKDIGSGYASYQLGLIYYKGLGVKKSIQSAFKYFYYGALYGDSKSCNMLGSFYSKPILIKKDYEKAIYWYEKAALNNYAPALNNLGKIFRFGNGVEIDYEKAFKYYEKSAKLGYVLAQNNLGFMYKNGYGTEIDYKKAIFWYEKAASSSNDSAMVNLAYIYKMGLGIKTDYKKALYYYEMAAKKDNPNAQNNIGIFYLKGLGVDKDYKKAIQYFNKALSKYSPAASTNLGYIYENGLGVKQDYIKAYNYYKIAINTGHSPAQFGIANLLMNGLGVEKDLTLAFKYFKKAAKQNHLESKYNLALMYYYGYGVSKDLNKAISWVEICSDENSAQGKYFLAKLKFTGEGVFTSYREAFALIYEAARLGFIPAIIELIKMYEYGLGVTKNIDEANRLKNELKDLQKIELDDNKIHFITNCIDDIYSNIDLNLQSKLKRLLK